MNLCVPSPILTLFLCVPFLGAKDQIAEVERPERAIDMRLEVILDSAQWVLSKNPTFVLRMTNPNSYPVVLRGFRFGYAEPIIEALLSDGQWHQMHSSGGTDSGLGGPPVVIAPGGSIEHWRFLYRYFVPGLWPDEPGIYQLRARSSVTHARIADGDKRLRIDWDCPVVQLVIVAPTTQDQAAIQFLAERFEEYTQLVRERNRRSRFHIELYTEFLKRYRGSVYKPETCWELAKRLPHAISTKGDHLREHGEMLAFWDECLTFCLDQGGAYADEFLQPMNDGGHELMVLAARYDRCNLAKRISAALDRRYPDAEEARLYRQMIIAGYTESVDEARKVSQTLAELFPDGPYRERATVFLKYLNARNGNQER